jgi:hypothetical protein
MILKLNIMRVIENKHSYRVQTSPHDLPSGRMIMQTCGGSGGYSMSTE